VNESGYRYVETYRGDTLQSIALREMGNAGRWAEIADLNNLLPPFITDDEAAASDRVILTGSNLAVPGYPTTLTIDETEVHGVDLALDKRGDIQSEHGDFAVISGVQNLSGALARRVIIEKRSRWFNPEYGCWVRELLGEKAGPGRLGLAAFYVKSSLLEDDRVESVLSCHAYDQGDALRVEAVIQPVSMQQITVEVLV